MKTYKGILILSVLSVIIMSSCTVSSSSKASANAEAKAEFSRMDFGKQNGESVSWYVVGDSGKYLTLFSEKVLDVKLYNWTDKYTEWGNTSLYEYLNTDFINEYFSVDERDRMIFTNDIDDCLVTMASTANLIDLYGDIYYAKDGYYGNHGFFAANEKIIAMPAEEAIKNDIYPFDNAEFAEIEQKEIDKRYNFANGAVPYWLLDQSHDGKAFAVTGTGYISVEEPTNGYIGIRPIIRIKK